MRPDGELVWITERGRVVSRDGDGRAHGRHQPRRDGATAARRRRSASSCSSQEREARDEAERQSRLKDEFLATLSHELRTPMNAILGWLAILESGKPVRDMSSALDVIQPQRARLQARLIDDLLDMNRLMSGNVQLEIARVDCRQPAARHDPEAAAGGRCQGGASSWPRWTHRR